MMKGRWTSGCRPTDPNISTIELQPEVWIHRDDQSLPGGGSRINGSQSGNPIKLKQWPIEGQQQQQFQPPPSTPRRSSLECNHSAAARVIPLSRWPLSDPRGGRRATFDSLCTGFYPRNASDNIYVPDPCMGGQSSDENCTKDRNRKSTGVRALKTNLFCVADTDWSQEDNRCFLNNTSRDNVNTNMCCLATDSSTASQSLLKNADRFDVTQHPVKDMGSSKVNQCPLNVMDLSKAHQCSLKDNDLFKDEQVTLSDKEETSKDEQKPSLQGKRGGEKCARLMSRLCHRKRSKHNAV